MHTLDGRWGRSIAAVTLAHFDQGNEQSCADSGKKNGQNHDFGWRKGTNRMFLILFFVLLVAWLLGFLAFHIAGALIHLLIIVAAICLIVHLVRGRSS